jgi:hypothetical protein
MKHIPRSHQHHDLYRKGYGHDSEISGLLGECGFIATTAFVKLGGDNRDYVMRSSELAPGGFLIRQIGRPLAMHVLLPARVADGCFRRLLRMQCRNLTGGCLPISAFRSRRRRYWNRTGPERERGNRRGNRPRAADPKSL